MKNSLENDATKTLYEKVKLTSEEIRAHALFTNIETDCLEHLSLTVFNLSQILLNFNANEPT